MYKLLVTWFLCTMELDFTNFQYGKKEKGVWKKYLCFQTIAPILLSKISKTKLIIQAVFFMVFGASGRMKEPGPEQVWQEVLTVTECTLLTTKSRNL